LLTTLKELGANAIEFPTIKIVQHHNSPMFAAFLKNFLEYRYLVFTSVNGVDGFVSSLNQVNLDLRVLYGKKIVCIGPATANAFIKRGIVPDYVPETFVAEALLPWFKEQKPAKTCFLRAEKARETLPKALRACGFHVDVIPVYHTEFAHPEAGNVIEMLKNGKVDMVTFTSSSTVEGFASLTAEAEIPAADVPAAVIGPITKETALSKGYTIKCQAEEYTVPGLVAAMLGYFS
jgi:uroporphyrinogen III methyltransferase/synthase